MKRLLFLFAIFTALLANAQSKLDADARFMLDQHRRSVQQKEFRNSSALQSSEPEYFTVIVKFDGDATEILKNHDFEVASSIGSLAILRVTPDQIELLSQMAEVKNVALDKSLAPSMIQARSQMGVDAVQTALPEADNISFTGKGVVTGIFDMGVDVNHINFLDSQGKPRTKLLCHYPDVNSENIYATEDEIANFKTDSSEETHGTHVLGILAGGYRGPAKYISAAEGLVQQDNSSSSMPYYGIAVDSDIAVGCGQFWTSAVLKGMQRIIDYAESEGKPCVINLSLGNNRGPRDGSDLWSQYLAELGKKSIICISAGNEGDYPISINAEGEAVKTFLCSNTSLEAATGSVEFWASDDRPFTLHFLGYDLNKGELFRYSVINNMEGKTVDLANVPGYDSVFDGTAFITSNIDTSNNRYNIALTLNMKGASSTIFPAVIVEPVTKSQTVYGYTSSTVKFDSCDIDGFADGNADNSINGMACGENVIAVGAYCSSKKFSTIEGKSYSFSDSDEEGGIAYFSSYGMTPDGRQLPHVCAPGKIIISSYNRYYSESSESSANMMSGLYEPGTGGLKNYWGYMQGTSMATPMVAGVVALWLEADPTLNVNDVKEIILATSKNDSFTKKDPKRWGAGKINARDGIRYILGIEAGINGIAADNDSMSFTNIDGRHFSIRQLDGHPISAAIYDLSGRCVAIDHGNADLVLSAEGCDPGVYLIRMESSGVSKTHKIVIK